MKYVKKLKFQWGMTSNAILINDDVAHKLFESGMRTISVSIDGLKETHDRIRQLPGAYEKAINGINALIRHGGFKEIQVTTVINHNNINELDEMYEIFKNMDIDSW